MQKRKINRSNWITKLDKCNINQRVFICKCLTLQKLTTTQTQKFHIQKKGTNITRDNDQATVVCKNFEVLTISQIEFSPNITKPIFKRILIKIKYKYM